MGRAMATARFVVFRFEADVNGLVDSSSLKGEKTKINADSLRRFEKKVSRNPGDLECVSIFRGIHPKANVIASH